MNNKTKILYVDDEPVNLQVFEINFNKFYNVYTCESAKQAFQILANNSDLKIVISDMNMPEMNGFEFIVKSREMYTDVKYFILTGFDITDEIKEALDKNIIYKYFVKPLDVKKIMAELNEALGLKVS